MFKQIIDGETEEARKKQRIYAAVSCLLVVVSAAFLLVYFHSPANNSAAPDGTLWKCANGHEFNLSTKQLNAYYAAHYGETMKCPTCGADADRALKCPHCQQIVVPHGERICPNCQQPLYTK